MKAIRNYTLVLTSIILTCVLIFATLAYAGSPITLLINGKTINCGNTSPQMINGRTYVPARFVAEPLGAAVNWNSSTNEIFITAGGSSSSVTSPSNDAAFVCYLAMKTYCTALTAQKLALKANVDIGELDAKGKELSQLSQEIYQWYPSQKFQSIKNTSNEIATLSTNLIKTRKMIAKGEVDQQSGKKAIDDLIGQMEKPGDECMANLKAIAEEFNRSTE